MSKNPYETLSISEYFPELSDTEIAQPISSFPTTIPPYTTSLVRKRCENCGKIHKVYRKDIERGKGTFCCLQCAAYHRTRLKFLKTCPNCHTIFRTLHDIGSPECCCLDCQRELKQKHKQKSSNSTNEQLLLNETTEINNGN